MRLIISFIILVFALPCFAQIASDGTQILGTIQLDQQNSSNVENQELDDDIVIDPNFLSDDAKIYESHGKVVIRILDKITAESRTYDLDIDKTVAFGSLRIRPKTCQKSPPIEEPESASFLQIWEKTPEANDEWVFSGWMFASSPSLSVMEHPVYDVWVIDCKNPIENQD
jgi:hypothetical protein